MAGFAFEGRQWLWREGQKTELMNALVSATRGAGGRSNAAPPVPGRLGLAKTVTCTLAETRTTSQDFKMSLCGQVRIISLFIQGLRRFTGTLTPERPFSLYFSTFLQPHIPAQANFLRHLHFANHLLINCIIRPALSGLPTCSLATPEDERDWVRTQGRDLVSSGYHSC
jgi:hypothetical protein